MKLNIHYPTIAAIVLLSSPFLGANNTSSPACENDNPTEDCCDCDTAGSGTSSPESCLTKPSDFCESEGNPFAVYSGNVIRRVEDLTFWNTPGEINFQFTRIAKSRFASTPQYFGNAHQWFHNWDVRLADNGIDPSTGRRLMLVRHANGRSTQFRDQGGVGAAWNPLGVNWQGGDRLYERTLANGDAFDGFEVSLQNGSTLRFGTHDFGQGSLHRLDEVRDQFQNVYSLTYNANIPDRLVKIEAPGGEQFFELTWGWRFDRRVITRVSASDGRFVDYIYEEHFDPEDDSRHRFLSRANYSDGTFACYTYSWESRNPFFRPLLGEARDPRVQSGARIITYEWDAGTYGRIIAEKNPLDNTANSAIVRRERDPVTGFITVSYGNGSSRTLDVPLGAGRFSTVINRTGGQSDFTYSGLYNRALRSREDSNGERVEYSWYDFTHFRPQRVRYREANGSFHERRRYYTDSGLLLLAQENPTSGGWFSTSYQRDAQDRLLRVDYPDGTFETWTRNPYGDPLTHRLRNGATQSWVYNEKGLKTAHYGPAKANETATPQSWTYYPTGLVHVHTLPTGGRITYEYNEIGEVTKESFDDGSFIVRSYQGKISDNPNQTFYDLTSLEKFESDSDTVPDVWSSSYDEFGRLIARTDAENHTTTWGYGDANQGICNTCTTRVSPLSMTSAEGRVTRYIYDEAWRQIAVARLTEGDGGANDYELDVTCYGPFGRVAYRVSDVVIWNQDPALLALTNPTVVAAFSSNASWTSYRYDPRGRPFSTSVWNGGPPVELDPASEGVAFTTVMSYDSFGNQLSTQSPGNRRMSYRYAGFHAVMRQMTSRTVSPDGGVTNYKTEYTWVNGEQVVMRDALNRKIATTFNGRGQILEMTYPDLTSNRRTYHPSGLLHQSFDELDRVSVITYDGYGRAVTAAAPGKAITQTTHRVMALGQVASQTDPTGVRVEYDYFDDGLRSQMTVAPGSPDAATSTYQYDRDHLLVGTVDPVGMVTSMSYDLLARRTSVTVPGNTAGDLLTTVTAYDTASDTVTTFHPDTTPATLADNPTSVTITDDLGRVISTTNENNETITYGYQAETSWMTSLTDARGKVTTWTYNDLGQMLSKTYPSNPVEVESYTYDAVQRLATHTRPSQKRASYSYDQRDRVTGITWDTMAGSLYGSGENQTFSYFPDGRLATQSNGLATTTRSYQAATGDPLTVSEAHSGGVWQIGYDYDDSGRLLQLSYPTSRAGSEVADYDYNLRGELVRVYNPDDGATAPLATYSRRSDGLVARLRFDNAANGQGTYTDTIFDTGKRETNKSHHSSTGTALDRNQYGYDQRSRRVWQEYGDDTGDRYSYDLAGQVKVTDYGASNPSAATGAIVADHSYNYDDMGNRTSFVVSTAGATNQIPVGSSTYTTNDKNQYTTVSSPTAPPDGVWNYDLDGNLIDDGSRLYVWDAWNRLREVVDKSSNALIASYTYDALGRRIQKTTTAAAAQGAESVLFLYDGWNVIQEWSAPNTLLAYLVWGEDLSGSMQGAGGVGGLLMRATSTSANYYHYDANGNVAHVLTSDPLESASYRYDAFGNLRASGAGTLAQDNPWKFSTKYHDPETGFSYYGYRYYDPVTGRWPSRDPIEERGGVNLYGFVKNSGINFNDFLGLYEAIVGENAGDCCACIEISIRQTSTPLGGGGINGLRYLFPDKVDKNSTYALQVDWKKDDEDCKCKREPIVGASISRYNADGSIRKNDTTPGLGNWSAHLSPRGNYFLKSGGVQYYNNKPLPQWSDYRRFPAKYNGDWNKYIITVQCEGRICWRRDFTFGGNSKKYRYGNDNGRNSGEGLFMTAEGTKILPW